MSGNAKASVAVITTEQLVTAAVLLNKQIKQKAADLEEVKASLIARGAGKHTGLEGESITVVAGAPSSPGKASYSLIGAEEEEKARELAGDQFSKLFDRTVTYTPCEGFQNVAPKLLKKAAAAALLCLCRVTGKAFGGRAAYVKFD